MWRGFWITFCVFLLMILGPVFQNCHNVHKTGITQTSDELNIKFSPQLMWYAELKTMDHFSCPWTWFGFSEHDLGSFLSTFVFLHMIVVCRRVRTPNLLTSAPIIVYPPIFNFFFLTLLPSLWYFSKTMYKARQTQALLNEIPFQKR